MLFAPEADLLRVSRNEDIGNMQTSNFRWTGVVRIVEKPVEEGVSCNGLTVSDDSFHQAADRVDHEHGRQLAAGNDEIAEGKLQIDNADDPFIEALIAATEEDHPAVGPELLGRLVAEQLSLR